MNIFTRKCKQCGQVFYKKPNLSVAEWKSRKKGKYCSKDCQSKSQLGNPAWNKGMPAPWAKNLPQQFKKGQSKPKNAYKWDKNEKHPLWKGDKASYSAIHYWVYRQLGKLKKCEHCKTIKAKRFEWANIDHKYSRNLKDYIRLCTSCHRKYDYKYQLK